MNKKMYLLGFLIHISALSAFSGAAVTHGVPGGFAGDFLMLYVRAKFISHKYGIPYLLPSVEGYHNHIVKLKLFHSEYKVADHRHLFKNNQEIKLNNVINPQSSTLYTINHFFKMTEWGDGLNVLTWNNMLNDEQFLGHLRDMVSLEEKVEPEFTLPEERVSVAVHVRTGHGLDNAGAQNYWPYKFPYIEYYISQLRRLNSMVKRGLHVHIFTDDINPESVTNQFKNDLKNLNITFSYRAQNHPRQNVLEDLIFMRQFDCLIRGMSHYSQIAQLLGQYKIVIYPKRFSGRQVVEVGTIVKDDRITRDIRFKQESLDDLFNFSELVTNDLFYRSIKQIADPTGLIYDTIYHH